MNKKIFLDEVELYCEINYNEETAEYKIVNTNTKKEIGKYNNTDIDAYLLSIPKDKQKEYGKYLFIPKIALPLIYELSINIGSVATRTIGELKNITIYSLIEKYKHTDIIKKENKGCLVLSHSDLDGIGCALLVYLDYKEYCGKDTHTVFTSYNNIYYKAKEIEELLNSKQYSELIITDFMPETKYLNSILKACAKNDVKLMVIDHHNKEASKEQLKILDKNKLVYHKEFDYCSLFKPDKYRQISASYLVYDFINSSIIKKNDYIKKIIKDIDLYDTYLFKEDEFKNDDSYKLNKMVSFFKVNRLFSILKDIYFDIVFKNDFDNYNKYQIIFNEIYEVETEKVEENIDKIIRFNGYQLYNVLHNGKIIKLCYVFNPLDGNEAANRLLDIMDIDAVIINYNNKTVSIRTNDKSNIRAIELASCYFNGKGHEDASGGSFNIKKEDLLQFLFESNGLINYNK